MGAFRHLETFVYHDTSFPADGPADEIDGDRTPDWAPPQRLLGLDEAAPFHRPKNLICLTLYNEPLERFAASLESMLRSLARADMLDCSVVAIVIDGLTQADPAVLAALEQAKRLHIDCVGPERASYFFSRGPMDVLLAALGSRAFAEGARNVQMIVVAKPANLGKLHSHALFFGTLCPLLNPTYCHQMDAGTLLAEDCVARLIGAMDNAPDLGAIAPRIATQSPSNHSPLAVWQFWDFVVSRAFLWPSEIATGHLSVIPGQYCVVRWRAMRDVDHGPLRAGEPVQAYLAGLQAREPLERVMFLAEDRVISNEIAIIHRGAWRFGYDPNAVAVTDTCTTLPELLRQRRRWTNSAMAARLRLIRRSVDLAGQSDCGWRERLALLGRCLWQTNLAVIEQIGPALLILAALALGRATISPVELASAGAWPTAMLAAFVVILTLGAATLVTFLGPGKIGQFRTLWLYLVVNPIISTIILIYAIFNMHDASWGTKGLTTNPGDKRDHRQMKNLRNRAVLFWLGANVLVLAAGLHEGAQLFDPRAGGSGPISIVIMIEIYVFVVVAFIFQLMAVMYAGTPFTAGRETADLKLASA